MRNRFEGVTFLENTVKGAMLEYLQQAPDDAKVTLVMDFEDDFVLMRTKDCRSKDMLTHGALISQLAREDLFGGTGFE